MGKTQSKSLGLYRKRDGPEGECFVVNAHFNPLAVAELDEAYKPPKTPSEITLSLSSCAKDGEFVSRAGFSEDKYPLKVVLPPEGSQTSSSCAKEAIEKSDFDESSVVEGKKDLAFHGFECDVSVEADVAGHEKQEFLFTLYDLDGYGKITKDDVASLVRSIYEAMGSSLKLPPSGSKTIRVRLTVAPDKKVKDSVLGAPENGKVCSEKEAKHVTEDEREHDEEDERNDADAEEDDEDGEEDLGNREKSYSYQIQTSHRHRHRGSDHSRKTANIASMTKNTIPCHRYSAPQPASNSHQQLRSSSIIDEQHPSLSPSPGRKRNKVSFSSPRLLQKHQLLEIIQANLEKNHFGIHVDSSKKRFGEHGEDEGHRRHSKLRQHYCTQRYKEGRSHYLDLAGIENYASVLDRNVDNDLDGCERIGTKCDVGGSGDSTCPYQAMDSNHVCSKIRERGHYACHKSRHHHRSKSHDLADSSHYFRYHMLPDDGELHKYARQNQLRVEEILKGGMEGGEKLDWFCASGKNHWDRDIQAALYHARSKSYDAYYCEAAPVSFSPRLKGRSSKEGMPAGSPHIHKHKHREREHQRAMQQVASWIEREHLGLGESPPSNLPKGDSAQYNSQQQRPHYHHHHHQLNNVNQRQSPPHGTPPRTPDKTPLLVERHEHHHFHEHYHHHYHHYHEL